MQLFNNAPELDELYGQRNDEETESFTKSVEIDIFDEEKKTMLNSMQELKARNLVNGEHSSSSQLNSARIFDKDY